MIKKIILVVVLSLFSISCDYRVFDLIEFPELQGVIDNPNIGNKVTEENFLSIYETVIKAKCLTCHNPEGVASAVLIDTYADLVSTELGPALVVPGNLEESIFYQVMLPSAGRKLMPPKKSGLSPVDEVRLQVIRSWISNGAPESSGQNEVNEQFARN